jgi:hypothetical protein
MRATKPGSIERRKRLKIVSKAKHHKEDDQSQS